MLWLLSSNSPYGPSPALSLQFPFSHWCLLSSIFSWNPWVNQDHLWVRNYSWKLGRHLSGHTTKDNDFFLQSLSVVSNSRKSSTLYAPLTYNWLLIGAVLRNPIGGDHNHCEVMTALTAIPRNQRFTACPPSPLAVTFSPFLCCDP